MASDYYKALLREEKHIIQKVFFYSLHEWKHIFCIHINVTTFKSFACCLSANFFCVNQRISAGYHCCIIGAFAHAWHTYPNMYLCSDNMCNCTPKEENSVRDSESRKESSLKFREKEWWEKSAKLGHLCMTWFTKESLKNSVSLRGPLTMINGCLLFGR